MTTCPVAHGSPDAAASPDRYAPVPSTVTVALTWPELPEPCMGKSDDVRDESGRFTKRDCARLAVVTGTARTRMYSVPDAEYGKRIALCLDHAGLHATDFDPDPNPDGSPRFVPDLQELVQARDTARWMAATDTERLAIASKDRSCPVTPEQMALAERTGLPRPMVTSDVHLNAFSDQAREIAHVAGLINHGHDTITLRLPGVYIGGHHAVVAGDFYSFREDTLRLIDDRLCCICGDPMKGRVALAAAYGKQQTSGGWGHPRCVVLAVRTCPHFTEPTLSVGPLPGLELHPAEPRYETVAYRWDGPGTGCVRPTMSDLDDIEADAEPLTWVDLRDWAKADPWGDA